MGSGLAFIAFSDSVIHLPGSPFFSVLFFLMLVSLGMDSMFGVITVLRNTLISKFPYFAGKKEIIRLCKYLLLTVENLCFCLTLRKRCWKNKLSKFYRIWL